MYCGLRVAEWVARALTVLVLPLSIAAFAMACTAISRGGAHSATLRDGCTTALILNLVGGLSVGLCLAIWRRHCELVQEHAGFLQPLCSAPISLAGQAVLVAYSYRASREAPQPGGPTAEGVRFAGDLLGVAVCLLLSFLALWAWIFRGVYLGLRLRSHERKAAAQRAAGTAARRAAAEAKETECA